MSKGSSIHAWWIKLPSRSRSLLVTWISGLSQDTSWDLMCVVKFARLTMGCAPAGSGCVAAALGCFRGVWGTAVGTGSTAPPHIYPEASWYPSNVCWIGMISYSLVRRCLRSSKIHQKSVRAWCTPLVSANLFPSTWHMASFIWMNNHLAPVKAISMDQSSPNTQWYFSTRIRFYLVGIPART